MPRKPPTTRTRISVLPRRGSGPQRLFMQTIGASPEKARPRSAFQLMALYAIKNFEFCQQLELSYDDQLEEYLEKMEDALHEAGVSYEDVRYARELARAVGTRVRRIGPRRPV